MSKTHGLSVVNGKRTRLNRIWKQMRQRCLNSKDSSFARYGGRGIKICKEWDSFVEFHKWAMSNGYADDLWIDRKDNNGWYSPENCEWSTIKKQARNKSNNTLITFRGQTLALPEWAERQRISATALRSRIFTLNWPLDKALTQPMRKLCRKQ